MFPIRDHNPSGETPYVTWALIAVNIAVFLGQRAFLSSATEIEYFNFLYGMIPARLSQGQGFVTVLTAMFLQGGWLHLGGNMLFLWVFGDNLEAALGRLRYLGFYLCCGLAATAAQYVAAPLARYPVIGASGAIAGVLGGYFLLFPKARVDVLVIFVIFFKVFPIPAWIVLGFWIGLQLYAGAVGQADGVAYPEHIGGFAAGFLLCLTVWRRRSTVITPAEPALVRSSIPKVPRPD